MRMPPGPATWSAPPARTSAFATRSPPMPIAAAVSSNTGVRARIERVGADAGRGAHALARAEREAVAARGERGGAGRARGGGKLDRIAEAAAAGGLVHAGVVRRPAAIAAWRGEQVDAAAAGGGDERGCRSSASRRPIPTPPREAGRGRRIAGRALTAVAAARAGEAVRRLLGEAAVWIAGQVALAATRAPRRASVLALELRDRVERALGLRRASGSRGTRPGSRRRRPRSVLRSDTTPRRSRAPRRRRRGPARTAASRCGGPRRRSPRASARRARPRRIAGRRPAAPARARRLPAAARRAAPALRPGGAGGGGACARAASGIVHECPPSSVPIELAVGRQHPHRAALRADAARDRPRTASPPPRRRSAACGPRSVAPPGARRRRSASPRAARRPAVRGARRSRSRAPAPWTRRPAGPRRPASRPDRHRAPPRLLRGRRRTGRDGHVTRDDGQLGRVAHADPDRDRRPPSPAPRRAAERPAEAPRRRRRVRPPRQRRAPHALARRRRQRARLGRAQRARRPEHDRRVRRCSGRRSRSGLPAPGAPPRWRDRPRTPTDSRPA